MKTIFNLLFACLLTTITVNQTVAQKSKTNTTNTTQTLGKGQYYISKSSSAKAYHVSQNCLSRSKDVAVVSEAEAIKMGKHACGNCMKGSSTTTTTTTKTKTNTKNSTNNKDLKN